jgi:hypothetical protein
MYRCQQWGLTCHSSGQPVAAAELYVIWKRRKPMGKRLIPAEKLQTSLLEQLYQAWAIRPGPNDFFPAQQIWDKVYEKFGKNIDGPLAEGVFNDLLKKGYIQGVKANDGTIAARLTSEGRDFLASIKEKIRTRRIALLGAFTGSFGLALTILKIVIDLVSK